jgi:hypothetical protein
MMLSEVDVTTGGASTWDDAKAVSAAFTEIEGPSIGCRRPKGTGVAGAA